MKLFGPVFVVMRPMPDERYQRSLTTGQPRCDVPVIVEAYRSDVPGPDDFGPVVLRHPYVRRIHACLLFPLSHGGGRRRSGGHGRPMVPPPVGGASNAAAAGSLADGLTDELLVRGGEVPSGTSSQVLPRRAARRQVIERQYPGYPGRLGNRASSSVCGGADKSSRYLGDLA